MEMEGGARKGEAEAPRVASTGAGAVGSGGAGAQGGARAAAAVAWGGQEEQEGHAEEAAVGYLERGEEALEVRLLLGAEGHVREHHEEGAACLVEAPQHEDLGDEALSAACWGAVDEVPASEDAFSVEALCLRCARRDGSIHPPA